MEYKDTKLIVFLRTFSKEELNEFEKFITAPYFRQSRDPLPLLKVLKKYHPQFTGDHFIEESIFSELNPDSDFSDNKSRNNFRSLTSYLLKALEEYLIISGIKNNIVLKNRIVLEKLLDRNLIKYYDQYLHKAENDLTVQERITGKDYLEKIQLGSLNSRYHSLKLDFKGFLEGNIKGVEAISSYFWLNLLRNAKTKYLNDKNYGIKTKNNSIEGLLKIVDLEKILEIHNDTSRHLDLHFNYYAYKCLINNKNSEYYKKTKEVFFKDKSRISRSEKIYYYSDLINIAGSSKGEVNNLEEHHSLIISCLEDKAYKVSDNDFMQPDFYRNAVLSATKLKNYEWAEKFVNEYTDELMPEYRDNMKYYSQAVINYGKGDYEGSLVCISKVKYDLIAFKLDVKIIMMKIFYQLELTEQFFSLADTFKHFIKNSRNLSEENKKPFLNYINYFLKILKLKSSFNKNDAGVLRDQISKEKFLYDKVWLVQKLDEISDVKRETSKVKRETSNQNS